jgi:hypothetical protein
MAKKAKVVNLPTSPVAVAAPPPPVEKPKLEATRWDRIQATRRKNTRTGEPIPGALGLAYLWVVQKNGLEKVAVLSKNADGSINIQRNIGGQLMKVGLKFLRTNEELWDAARKLIPNELPKHRVDPNTKRQWDPTKFTASQTLAIIKETE